jgi:hypothetical protein
MGFQPMKECWTRSATRPSSSKSECGLRNGKARCPTPYGFVPRRRHRSGRSSDAPPLPCTRARGQGDGPNVSTCQPAKNSALLVSFCIIRIFLIGSFPPEKDPKTALAAQKPRSSRSLSVCSVPQCSPDRCPSMKSRDRKGAEESNDLTSRAGAIRLRHSLTVVAPSMPLRAPYRFVPRTGAYAHVDMARTH